MPTDDPPAKADEARLIVTPPTRVARWGPFRVTWPRVVAASAALTLLLASASGWVLLPKDRVGLHATISQIRTDSAAIVLRQTEHDMSGRLHLLVQFGTPQSPIWDARVGPGRRLFVEPSVSGGGSAFRLMLSGAAPTDSGRSGFKWPSDELVCIGLANLGSQVTDTRVGGWWWFSSDDRSNDSSACERWRSIIRLLQGLGGGITFVAGWLSRGKPEEVRRRRLEEVFERCSDEFVPLTPQGEKLKEFLRLQVVEHHLSPSDALAAVRPADLTQRAWLVKEAKRIQPILQERFGAEAVRPLSLLARLTE